jgi:hypothetical protein
MDTTKLVEEKLDALFERAQAKAYRRRKMILEIDSDEEDENLFKVIGKMTLAVSETPDIVESWKEKTFDIMLTGKNIDILTGQVLAHLNSVPYEWGDMIFEEDFEDVLKETIEIVQGGEEASLPA